jgi:hypothetical protein
MRAPRRTASLGPGLPGRAGVGEGGRWCGRRTVSLDPASRGRSAFKGVISDAGAAA